ncbi:MAG: hypothetical protein ACOYN3_06860 [Acidimicrobiia bacterium]
MNATPVVESAELFDRSAPRPSLGSVLARRFDGGYVLDAFGADPQLQDLVAPIARRVLRFTIEGAHHIPVTGAASLVCNRGLGLAEPFVLATAVRSAVGRRLRIEGAPPLPIVREMAYKLGALGYHPDDVRAALRAGHLVGIPLAPTWFTTDAGAPPREVMLACTVAPIIPVAIAPGAPLGVPFRPWRVEFGEPIAIPKTAGAGDPLAAAELGDRVRRSVRALLRTANG